MLSQDSDLTGSLYGKTGSCLGSKNQQRPDHGWYIGWVDWNSASKRNPSTTFVVINTTGAKAWGWEAKKIALKILHDLQPGNTPTDTTE